MVHAPGHSPGTFVPFAPFTVRLFQPFAGTMHGGQMSPENTAAVRHLTADQGQGPEIPQTTVRQQRCRTSAIKGFLPPVEMTCNGRQPPVSSRRVRQPPMSSRRVRQPSMSFRRVREEESLSHPPTAHHTDIHPRAASQHITLNEIPRPRTGKGFLPLVEMTGIRRQPTVSSRRGRQPPMSSRRVREEESLSHAPTAHHTDSHPRAASRSAGRASRGVSGKGVKPQVVMGSWSNETRCCCSGSPGGSSTGRRIGSCRS